MEDLGIGLALFAGTVVFVIISKIMRKKKGEKAGRFVEEGKYGDAIKLYRKQLLGVLELGMGTTNEDNPRRLLEDAKEKGEAVMQQLAKAYSLAGIDLDTSQYENLLQGIEALISNPDNFGLAKQLKGPAKKKFKQIRKDLKEYITRGMPAIEAAVH